MTVPVPVYAAVGAGAWGPVQELRGRPELRLVPSPRHASVLLVAGEIPPAHRTALDRVHDQLPHPRVVVAWSGAPAPRQVAPVVATGDHDDVVATVLAAHGRVLREPSATASDRLPDEEPAEWRGVGPHGQGGEGMMGGTPYGRPMAMIADDRDGLALDRLQLTLGPFLDPVPPGYVLDVALQGDVLQELAVRPPPPPGAAGSVGAPLADDPGVPPAPVAVARQGLRWLAWALHVYGCDAHAARAARLATAAREDADLSRPFRSLRRRLRWTGLSWTLRGVGTLDEVDGADAAGRWATRLDAIDRALRGEVSHRPPVPPLAELLAALPRALAGASLGDAITTLASVDLAHAPARETAP